jgi:NAD(P)-dependent dehydrogenase (short-subunit alcohol dehydrogenase family)
MPSRSEQSPGRRRAVRSDALFNREKILTAAADTLAARGLAPELAEPDEIAAVAVFLLSDASFLTGSTVDAAGGWM